MADDIGAALAEIRERAHELTIDLPQEDHCGSVSCTGHDALRLLAAVEAALKLTEPTGEVHRDLDGNEEGGVVRVVRCDTLRAAITAALTGADVPRA